VRAAQGRAIRALPPGAWDHFFSALGPVVPARLRHRNPGFKLHKVARALTAASLGGLYAQLASQWGDPASLVLGADEPPTVLTEARQPALSDATARMMYLDLISYLPDDVLTKLDRASMRVSLEARVPLIDHRVVEFAWQLPQRMKIRNGESKWILRQVLGRYVPRRLTDRPKSGFAVPLGAWLRGPLRPWAEALLDERRLRAEGFLDPTVVRTHWAAHTSGRTDLGEQLWNVLMFQAWLDGRGGVPPAHAGSARDLARVAV
jgi:asparagine synthase (glutamine-hydrolysing)